MKKRKQKNIISQDNKKEIFYKIINAGLSGALVLLGSITTAGEITLKGLFISVVTALLVAIQQFREYWLKEENEYCKTQVFAFIK